jgi:hypothetical protein
LLVANLSALSQADDLFAKKSEKLNLIDSMFKLIKSSELTSDLAFSTNLFLLRNCNRNQIETNGFEAMLARIKKYLEICAKDLKNESKESLDKSREVRDLKIGPELLNCKIYAMDIDNSGIRTTLNVILESLSLLASKADNKSDIYNDLKSYLYTILEKGNTGEKKLVLDVFTRLAFDEKISEDMKQNIGTIRNSFQGKDSLIGTYNNLLYVLGENYEIKPSPGHDLLHGSKSTQTILFAFNSPNEERCRKLNERLEKEGYAVRSEDIEGKCFCI